MEVFARSGGDLTLERIVPMITDRGTRSQLPAVQAESAIQVAQVAETHAAVQA